MSHDPMGARYRQRFEGMMERARRAGRLTWTDTELIGQLMDSGRLRGADEKRLHELLVQLGLAEAGHAGRS